MCWIDNLVFTLFFCCRCVYICCWFYPFSPVLHELDQNDGIKYGRSTFLSFCISMNDCCILFATLIGLCSFLRVDRRSWFIYQNEITTNQQEFMPSNKFVLKNTQYQYLMKEKNADFFGKFSIFLMSTSFKPDLNCPQCSIKDVVLIQQHQKNNGFQQQHKQEWIVFLV